VWDWLIKYGNDIVVLLTVIGFVVSVAVLGFSAFRYVSVRRDELTNIRYQKYHQLIRVIGKGEDAEGSMKLVSQRAFIYELRHFPEYSELTIRLLEGLVGEWKERPEISNKLTIEIQDTISALRK
jgi:hypothetical protein